MATSETPGMVKLGGAVSRWVPTRVKLWAYRVPGFAAVARRLLNRASPTGVCRVQVSGGFLNGMSMSLDLQREKYYWLGTYEPQLQARVAALAPAGATVYDVGANIGYITLMFARAVGPQGKVIAFEALPEQIERLRDNVTMNGLDGVVTVEPVAVADAAGSAEFLVHASASMGKLRDAPGRDTEYAGRVRVATVSLDHYVFELGRPRPDLIKLDIEGGEVKALPGMRRVLAECRPRVVLELHGPQAADTAWDVFEQTHYRLCRLADATEITDRGKLDWKEHLLAEPRAQGGASSR